MARGPAWASWPGRAPRRPGRRRGRASPWLQLLALGALAVWSCTLGRVLRRGRGESWAFFPPAAQIGEGLSAGLSEWGATAAVVAAVLAAAAVSHLLRRRRLGNDARPWDVYGDKWEESVVDPLGELTTAIEQLQDALVLPVNKRLPGGPFEYDIQAFPFTPMVLVIGNHSSGKSTFINQLLGVDAQDTGVAPTDDGFTVLERHREPEIEDGPTLIGCSQNRPFRDLQRFGRAFSGHLRRKRLVLPESSSMPFGLQIIDTPGMIDMPGNDQIGQVSAKSRGYNFIEVVRWWAKRADLILLLFDPDKPGTTGETLEVLTKSLAGLEHKFVILLNKVDRLDNPVDFARAYGTLGWALSKVIPLKDIPMIWTTYSADKSRPAGFDDREHLLPLEAFRRRREEVITEVLRAKVRHWDNVITSFEETLRQVEMIVSVCRLLRARAMSHLVKVWLLGLPPLALPGLFAAWLFSGEGLEYDLSEQAVSVICGVYVLFCCAVVAFMWDYSRQGNRLQAAHLESCFQEVYAHVFVHSDAEDYRLRWCVVRPKIENLLRAVHFAFALPYFGAGDSARINQCLENDLPHLRRLAKMARPPEPAAVEPPSATPMQYERRPSVSTPRSAEQPPRTSNPLSEPPQRRNSSERIRPSPSTKAQAALGLPEDTEEEPVSGRDSAPRTERLEAEEKSMAPQRQPQLRPPPQQQQQRQQQVLPREAPEESKPKAVQLSAPEALSQKSAESGAADTEPHASAPCVAAQPSRSGSSSSAPARDDRPSSVGGLRKRQGSLNTIAEEEPPATLVLRRRQTDPTLQQPEQHTQEEEEEGEHGSPALRRAKTDLVLQRLGELDEELAAARRHGPDARRKPRVTSIASPQHRRSPDPQDAAEAMPATPPRSQPQPDAPAAEAWTPQAPVTPGEVTPREPTTMEVESAEIGCVCGYTCGTAKALERHLARFRDDSRHAAQYSLG